MSGLPQGWSACTIGNLVKQIEKGQPQSDFTYIDISSIDNKTKKILEPNLVEESKAPSRARQHLKEGDVLVSMTRPNLNAVAILDAQYPTPIASTGFDVLRADEPTNHWLFSHVRSKQFVDVMTEKVQGALYPAIKSADVRNYPINLPPANEQKRIVAKLESCEARIDAAREALDDVPKLLEHYRQSVLAAAFRGDLTRDWRKQQAAKAPADSSTEASAKAEQLLESLRAERRQRWEQAELEKYEAKGKAPPKDWKKKYKAPQPLTDEQLKELPELPEGWCWANLGEIVEHPKYGTSRKCEYTVTPYPVLRIPNIASGIIENTDLKYAEMDLNEAEGYFLNADDILMIRSNGSLSIVGKCALTEETNTRMLFAGYLILLRTTSKSISPSYLLRQLESNQLRHQIERAAKSTSGVNNINAKQIQSLVVAICPEVEQQEISRIMEIKLNSVKKQIRTMMTSSSELETLTQSLLAKAFRGELVPQDPNDEPASKLLERIAEARQQKAKTKVPTKSKRETAAVK